MITLSPSNNSWCQSADQQRLAIHSPHTCHTATCVTDADGQTTTHGWGGRDHQQSYAIVGADSVVVQRGWSQCTSCSLMGNASSATAPSYHPLAVTPFTPSNDLIIVPDLHCLSNAAAACGCVYCTHQSFWEVECGLCRSFAIWYDICEPRYRRVDTSAIDIATSPNRFEH